ncbi:hypothetical protein DFJ73DRAFT_429317 [Zopfochytrium polystomum]|nr:hypothetical protein DFJ73DRAFT_429317 [Zopfochytrium polystomum]
MGRIDEALLRKRAEHNDGELSSLREVTLHQFDIEKIENLDVYCRHLEILYLQNNLINKIENLHKLKELQYLNLALNNIKKIENLQGCESLRKLDLTVNFVEDLLDLESLKVNFNLQELFLVGNPLTQVDGYRAFAVATLPQLKFLDGKEIDKSERILALQVAGQMRDRLLLEQQRCIKQGDSAVSAETPQLRSGNIEGIKEDFLNKPVPHTPEARLEAAADIRILNSESDRKTSRSPKTSTESTAPAFAADGRVLQRNQGKWSYRLDDDEDAITLQVEISRFLDTSLIDVNVHPTWVRVTIKGQILQLCLDSEVAVDKVNCERCQSTGLLAVTMLKSGKSVEISDYVAARKRRASELSKTGLKTETTLSERGTRTRRNQRLLGVNEKLAASDVTVKGSSGMITTKAFLQSQSAEVDAAMDSDVPPLC